MNGSAQKRLHPLLGEFDEKERKDQYDKKMKTKGFGTRAVHAGQPPEAVYGSVNVPIHASSTYAQSDAASPYYPGMDYSRVANPTRDALERCMAALEDAQYCHIFSSGCAATNTISNLLKHGDEILCVDDVYGGTHRYFAKVLAPATGIKITFADFGTQENVEKHINANTKMIWLETPTNPTLKVFDIEMVAKIAKAKNILFVVDNTFMTPYFQKPLSFGADISVNSMTKYMGGHSDMIMAYAVMNSKEVYDKLAFLHKSIGGNSSAFDCYLALRSAKTLHVRMEQH